ncbi:hypothetical protein L485_06275 [Sphingobium baderi LL03]|uniref:Uncharacterized protein n=1 Tax=Sphingobium baderi LL03 TaxID=1114964 RepID=T0HVR4_9SPHN|nr:hypothetical protein L485_06275 [Sphingobium baderi LL03]
MAVPFLSFKPVAGAMPLSLYAPTARPLAGLHSRSRPLKSRRDVDGGRSFEK